MATLPKNSEKNSINPFTGCHFRQSSKWTQKYTLADGTSRTIEGDNAWPYHMRYIVRAIKSTGAEFIP